MQLTGLWDLVASSATRADGAQGKHGGNRSTVLVVDFAQRSEGDELCVRGPRRRGPPPRVAEPHVLLPAILCLPPHLVAAPGTDVLHPHELLHKGHERRAAGLRES